MSDRDAAAETKEPYALARRGLPLRGLAPTPPRAHWLPPLARTQAMPALPPPAAAQAEASPFENGEFDPFGLDPTSPNPAPTTAASPLIRDAGAALSIIADEGFERATPASTPSRTRFAAADTVAPRPASTQVPDAAGAEMFRADATATSEAGTQRFIRDPFAAVDLPTPVASARPMSSPASTDVFDAPATAVETPRIVAVSEPAGASPPRGAVASRERDPQHVATAPHALPSSIAPEFPHVVVSDARRIDPTPSSAATPRIANADAPTSSGAARARAGDADETLAASIRRDAVDTRGDMRRPADAGPRHETVDMGTPAAAPSTPRRASDAPVRAFATPRPLDAAQIASLLAPQAASNANSGPSVTIDRVQVTVQAAAARPTAPAAPAAPPAATPQRAVPSPSYRNPWASYFARRD